MKKWATCLLALFTLATPLSHAKTVTASLYLQNIKAVKKNESSSDEIYFSITEFSSTKKNLTYTVPGFITHDHRRFVTPTLVGPAGVYNHPVLHWNSAQLKKVNHAMLWEKKLNEGESVELFLTVIEHDAQPFDLDDPIGALKIRVTNTKGKLLTLWRYLGNTKSDLISSSKNEKGERKGYQFLGSNSKYILNFHLMLDKANRGKGVNA